MIKRAICWALPVIALILVSLYLVFSPHVGSHAAAPPSQHVVMPDGTGIPGGGGTPGSGPPGTAVAAP